MSAVYKDPTVIALLKHSTQLVERSATVQARAFELSEAIAALLQPDSPSRPIAETAKG